MNKILVSSLLALSLFSFTPPNLSGKTIIPSLEAQKPKTENYDCRYGQCQATAKSTGRQCKHCVSNPNDFYCWQHK